MPIIFGEIKIFVLGTKKVSYDCRKEKINKEELRFSGKP